MLWMAKKDSQKMGNVNKTRHQRYVFHGLAVVIILNTLVVMKELYNDDKCDNNDFLYVI